MSLCPFSEPAQKRIQFRIISLGTWLCTQRSLQELPRVLASHGASLDPS